MTGILELIQTVEAAGGKFLINGDRLGIAPATAAAPVLEELRRYKAELLAELRTRRPAVVPSVPSQNKQVCNAPEYDAPGWYVRGQRVTRFPRCPACRSFYLIPENGTGLYECVSCELTGISESEARNYDDAPAVIQ